MPRYNPEVDGPYKTYISAAHYPVIQDTRRVEVLAHVFTHLAASFHQKAGDIVVDRAEFEGITIPLRRYHHSPRPMGEEYFENTENKQPGYLTRDDVYLMTWPAGNKGAMLEVTIPVGEYGVDLGWAIMDATRATYSLIGNSMREECSHVDRKYKYFIGGEGSVFNRETAQAHSIHTLIEGVQTIGLTLALLTLRKAPGFEDDPLQLMRALHDGKLLDEISQRAPTGLLAPMAREGISWARSPLEVDEESGEMFLSEETKRYFANSRQEARPSAPGFRARGCPAGKPDVVNAQGGTYPRTGIDYMAEVFLRQLEYQYPLIVQAQQETTIIEYPEWAV